MTHGKEACECCKRQAQGILDACCCKGDGNSVTDQLKVLIDLFAKATEGVCLDGNVLGPKGPDLRTAFSEAAKGAETNLPIVSRNLGKTFALTLAGAIVSNGKIAARNPIEEQRIFNMVVSTFALAGALIGMQSRMNPVYSKIIQIEMTAFIRDWPQIADSIWGGT